MLSLLSSSAVALLVQPPPTVPAAVIQQATVRPAASLVFPRSTMVVADLLDDFEVQQSAKTEAIRAKREAPRGLEVSLRISDRQINARAHPYDLQHWATRVLPFAVELYFPGRDRALPRLRLRRDFFKYLIDDVILDTPNSVRATLNVAMVN